MVKGWTIDNDQNKNVIVQQIHFNILRLKRKIKSYYLFIEDKRNRIEVFTP